MSWVHSPPSWICPFWGSHSTEVSTWPSDWLGLKFQTVGVEDPSRNFGPLPPELLLAQAPRGPPRVQESAMGFEQGCCWPPRVSRPFAATPEAPSPVLGHRGRLCRSGPERAVGGSAL